MTEQAKNPRLRIVQVGEQVVGNVRTPKLAIILDRLDSVQGQFEYAVSLDKGTDHIFLSFGAEYDLEVSRGV
ncbi:hypothetical protein [Mycetocola saprophilus]|uniref:hypothetical protein n=1 Tax=Mycetocola saprophilus TaxID=76636 RepID=UPI0004BEB3C7|nr:hypothetical protein [Mycetocola saprophilus]